MTKQNSRYHRRPTCISSLPVVVDVIPTPQWVRWLFDVLFSAYSTMSGPGFDARLRPDHKLIGNVRSVGGKVSKLHAILPFKQSKKIW
jgi:hypothetical protein